MNKKPYQLASSQLADILDPEKAQKMAEFIVKEMNENKGMTLQQALGLPNEVLEEIYSLAYGHYNVGKYQEAVALFQMLFTTSPASYKYALGLGASFHQLELYNDAILGFFHALHIEPQNPTPAFFIADSLIKQGEHPDMAVDFLNVTIESCGNQEKYQTLKERSLLMKKSIKENK